MSHTYWFKQTSDNPLFPDLIWNRPENRLQAGKLLIVGGNVHGFAAPAESYDGAVKAGIGTAKVLLPDALQKVVGNFLEAAEFAPSTPSGSFALGSLDAMLDLAAWSDGVLFAGDVGRNSETAIVLERFLTKHPGITMLTKDAADYFISTSSANNLQKDIALVLSIGQLQKLAVQIGATYTFTHGMDLIHLVERLHEFTSSNPIHIVVKHGNKLTVASGGQVSTTESQENSGIWRAKTAGKAAVWWLQNPASPFKALTSSLS